MVHACQRHEANAQSAFYDRYKARLLGVCQRYTRTTTEAEDIFQEAFVRVFHHIGDLRDPETADQWVKTIVVRTAINYYHRSTKSVMATLTEYDPNTDERTSDDYAALLARFGVDELCAIISQMPEHYRIVVNLYLIDGYSHADIAGMLNIAENTSKSQLSRGRAWLINKLNQLGHRYEPV